MYHYKKLINPKEEQVNNFLNEGYVLHSITNAKLTHYRDTEDLIYHFIKYPNQEFNLLNITESKTLYNDINGLDTDLEQ